MSDPIAVGDVFEYVHEGTTETHEVVEVRDDEVLTTRQDEDRSQQYAFDKPTAVDTLGDTAEI